MAFGKDKVFNVFEIRDADFMLNMSLQLVAFVKSN